MELLRNYFILLGWNVPSGKRRSYREIVKQVLIEFAENPGKSDLDKLEEKMPDLHVCLKRLPESLKLSGLFFLYEGLNTEGVPGSPELLALSGALQRLRGTFPSVIPSPAELVETPALLLGATALSIFEGYDRKIKAEISRLMRKPFVSVPENKPVRFFSSGKNYEIYTTAGVHIHTRGE